MKFPRFILNTSPSRAALALVAAVVAHPVAAAGYCSGGDAGALSLADMTLNGALASDCYGVVSGNDKTAAINSLAWASDWTLLTKDETTGWATFMGIAFDLDRTGTRSGTWALSAYDPDTTAPLNLPVELDVVAVLKASNRYAAYFFDDAVFDGSDGGTWSVAFVNGGGQIPDLSHLSFYVRIDEDGGIPSAIPEPGTYALFLAGLALVGFAARCRGPVGTSARR